MVNRRDALKLGLAAAGSGLIGFDRVMAQSPTLLENLCSPQNRSPDTPVSPASRPFVAPLYIMPVKQPIPSLDPSPDPNAHQRYEEYPPKKFYEIRETEFRWVYHPDAPYNAGSWSWGFDGGIPGPTYHARYGEPILVRMMNMLPSLANRNIQFATPKTTTHLHNGHTASESDGYPMYYIESGSYWDHHYACFPAHHDEREKLTTLWYHDHMMASTAPNVYAGLSGFFLLFDENDSGNENDASSKAWGLPSGKYDVPLILHDVLFTPDGQASFPIFNTDGVLGDKFTVNRTIQPYFQVERRKYRFRLLNGGPSRFYQLYLSSGQPFVAVTGDGNFLPKPVVAESIFLSVAQRVDVILDFSEYKVGDQIILQNRLEQVSGAGPSGRILDPGDGIMRFDVIDSTGPDNSRIPSHFRSLPEIPKDLSKYKERIWEFDYMGGLWTVNGKIFGMGERIDAEIEEGSGEVWIFRNQGKNWSHPIHSHFTEFLLREVNGTVIEPTTIQSTEFRRHFEFEDADKPIKVFMGGQRRDIATLFPNDELKVFMRWSDFQGRYVMHCHNVVHEDHDMMIRWDIIPKRGEPPWTGKLPTGKIKNP